jgi:hypothetical protein
MKRRLALAFAAICAIAVAGIAIPAMAAQKAAAATPFKVLAFYSGTYDAAHIDFEKEARVWFPQQGATYGFTFEATTDWSRLNTVTPAQYQVVMFLDDIAPANTHTGFQRYMDSGGGFFGFHVSAFNTDPNSWSWYHNTFLGTGAFQTNSWGPTPETLKIEDRNHPATAGLPATIQSSTSEWYSWTNDLRKNPNIDILASMDQSTFPIGTDPNQTWYSGYYPIVWTNKNYKMIYANFGHNAMNYTTNTRLSSTFESAQQNQLVINGLLWLGGSSAPTSPSPTPSVTTSPTGPISPTAWYSLVNKNSSKCVDARTAASANGTAIQQYTCNNTTAQQFQFQPTTGANTRVNSRLNSAQSFDVTGVSTADTAKIQLWNYVGGANQQWQPVSEGGGYYHLVNLNSGKCLDTPSASTADSVQLQQYTCNGSAAQSFSLVAH